MSDFQEPLQEDFQAQYALWEEFLSIWPASRLASMTLDEYTQSGNKTTFTYWLEHKLGAPGMGSIAGGSAFKFGVFARRDSEDKAGDAKLRYSDTHAWYAALGTDAQAAFAQVRQQLQAIAQAAAAGQLDAIESMPFLGSATKWKVAFHYQNRAQPMMLGVLTQAPLRMVLQKMHGKHANHADHGQSAGHSSAPDTSMAQLQAQVLALRDPGQGILEFGRQVWLSWERANMKIWKLSHGNAVFTDEERSLYLHEQRVMVHQDTSAPGPGEQQKGKQGKDFADAPMGALFFLCHGNSPQLLGQFTSAAGPCSKGAGWLQRNYRVLQPALHHTRYSTHTKGWSPQGNSTFWPVPERDLPEFESTLLQPYFGMDLAQLAALVNEPTTALDDVTTASGAAQAHSTPGKACFNRIYYGPPGTGKTHRLMQLLREHYEPQAASVSPEEWRRQMVAEKVASLKWWEGAAAALYDLGGKAKVADLAEHRFIVAMTAANGSNRNVRQTLWRTLQNHTVEASTTVNMQKRLSPAVFDKTADSVWQFAGDWSEACADLIALVDHIRGGPQGAATVQRYSFVTFHQSYGYEEFVEGLRPVLSGDAQTGEAGEVAYEIRSGVFKELCRKARQAPEQRFAMVIDEINRGNISKILGELITLIEPDKRDPLDGNKPPIELTLAYSGEKFSVPANVDIIGTMNTADRSLALLDTALRRRFDFVPLYPDTRATPSPDEPGSAPLAELVVTTDAGVIDVRQMLLCINQRIEALYDRDHTIGHAYFTPLWNKADGAPRFAALAETFRQRIVPLLEEYFFEDWHKIRLVLGDHQKPEAAQFITESNAHDLDLGALFGNDHGLESHATQRRYHTQPSAFADPAAYLGIYQISV